MIDLTKLKTANQKAQEATEQALAQTEHSRRAAYIKETDPLFFKVQRGEATMEEWQAKIAEIKAKYPKEQA
jgi:hypothetical protein